VRSSRRPSHEPLLAIIRMSTKQVVRCNRIVGDDAIWQVFVSVGVETFHEMSSSKTFQRPSARTTTSHSSYPAAVLFIIYVRRDNPSRFVRKSFPKKSSSSLPSAAVILNRRWHRDLFCRESWFSRILTGRYFSLCYSFYCKHIIRYCQENAYCTHML